MSVSYIIKIYCTCIFLFFNKQKLSRAQCLEDSSDVIKWYNFEPNPDRTGFLMTYIFVYCTLDRVTKMLQKLRAEFLQLETCGNVLLE